MSEWRIRYVRTRPFWFIPYWRGEGLHNSFASADAHLYSMREREKKHPVGSVALTTTPVDGK